MVVGRTKAIAFGVQISGLVRRTKRLPTEKSLELLTRGLTGGLTLIHTAVAVVVWFVLTIWYGVVAGVMSVKYLWWVPSTLALFRLIPSTRWYRGEGPVERIHWRFHSDLQKVKIRMTS